VSTPKQASRNVFLMAGIVAVAAGGSWGFYYLMKPARD
jgi:hypothetical protein